MLRVPKHMTLVFCRSAGNLLIILVLTLMNIVRNKTGSSQDAMPFVYFCEVGDGLKLKNVVFF